MTFINGGGLKYECFQKNQSSWRQTPIKEPTIVYN